MIGGNTIAQLQISTSEKTEIGAGVKRWSTVLELSGFLDLSSGDSKYTTYNAKVQESSHIFICDWKPVDVSIKAENSRLLVNGSAYDVMLMIRWGYTGSLKSICSTEVVSNVSEI